MELAKRVSTLTPSSTLAITAKAKELKEQGHDVIGLGAGEPDFNTPQYIIDAAVRSMEEGHTKYTPSGGLPKLKEAIIEKFKQDQGLTYTAKEIFVGTGAKHVLYTLFQALLNEGDEVIIPSPYWVSYPEQVKLAGGEPVFVEGKESNDFKLTPAQLEPVLTDRTKAIIINSPSNPTGSLYTQEELAALGEVCLKHNVLIISDEIYEKLVYDGAKHTSVAEISPQLKENTVVINGVSKSHSMTGWRIGYAAGPEALIQAMTNLASHSTSNPTTSAQYGAIAAYTEDDGSVEKMRVAFEERLHTIYDKLVAIPGVSCVKPKGAFYLFPNVEEAAALTGHETVDDFVKVLLEEEKVALVPGSGFGAPDNVRLSYATSLELLEAAIDRIFRFVEAKRSK
ncbi:pyridoxal phosphate-dependent aminotransferase [Halalkalibacterium halodurans]|uniref:Aminotransferase n=1 Tax=Halalkalibacterium halodurans (strain ATCC BAA-125 / DSM 18197 / FERM 7344 / JCM 9153 / C-125) TaxID=272558 RepID=Q9KC79_HALH5|nr:pyridoxal phosphate-dependent aminotransferase [Halalkalibacterium halodurans]MED4081328.1 pyridoxal phosphate-dependent aminotransferase [Halalkalibacterium halodurans]MED4086867.1 pyridoxal phosphate-dependent aminotransferase [Halalkalibacterium halodurans]MED4104358.1 pyridoxal phosphate-dependent aminotransferase [Halalkalibacterium halodurans]MED4109179.1 pyridoxal phosphate-dependent aminotransferase [Halalkalibacterium halodurans]MED4150784.1 pyridoxal phosphate-dependent aminotrans